MRTNHDESGPIYEGAFFRIGRFRRGTQHPDFSGPHQIGGALLVFPRSSVIITHAGQAPIVADPNVVMFYNHGQVYSRGKLSEAGDLCEWFGFDPQLIVDAIRPFDAHVDDRPLRPFPASHGPSDAAGYLLQRLVVDQIMGNEQPDPLFIEESVLHILERVIGNYYHQQGNSPSKKKTSLEKEIVEGVQKELATSFTQNLSLEGIALRLHYSPFHLCRLFRKYTGRTIHQYLTQLRLRASLEYVNQAGTDLTDLALKVGFASHSHFTQSFRKTFGAPPSKLRDVSRRQARQYLSKISIA